MGVKLPLTRASGMGPLPDLLEERGGDKAVARVFSANDLPLALIEEREQFIPLTRMIGLFDVAARASADPVFGLRVGLSMPPSEYGLWARYALQAATLGDAITRLIAHFGWHQSGGGMRLSRREAGCVAWEYFQVACKGGTASQHTDHVLPVMVRFARTYLGADWRPVRIEADYALPQECGQREALTQTHWRFRQPAAAIVLRTEDLMVARPCSAHDSSAVRTITSKDVRSQSQEVQRSSLSEQVSAIIALRLLDGSTDIEGVAVTIGVGRRSLQRLLSAEGHTYRALLDQVRMQRARALLSEARLPATRVAFELGYSDAAHFSRAYKRHFGFAPSQQSSRHPL